MKNSFFGELFQLQELAIMASTLASLEQHLKDKNGEKEKLNWADETDNDKESPRKQSFADILKSGNNKGKQESGEDKQTEEKQTKISDEVQEIKDNIEHAKEYKRMKYYCPNDAAIYAWNPKFRKHYNECQGDCGMKHMTDAIDFFSIRIEPCQCSFENKCSYDDGQGNCVLSSTKRPLWSCVCTEHKQDEDHGACGWYHPENADIDEYIHKQNEKLTKLQKPKTDIKKQKDTVVKPISKLQKQDNSAIEGKLRKLKQEQNEKDNKLREKMKEIFQKEKEEVITRHNKEIDELVNAHNKRLEVELQELSKEHALEFMETWKNLQ